MKKIFKLAISALALIIAIISLSSCEREDKILCTKVVNTIENGIIISSDTSKIISLKGSYVENGELTITHTTVTFTQTKVDCNCD